MSGDIFGCCSLGGGGVATGIWWVEARNTANILWCTGQPPTTKNEGTKKIKSPETEKPRFSVRAGMPLKSAQAKVYQVHLIRLSPRWSGLRKQ